MQGSWGRCLTGRESIFLFPHTNEFCGKWKVAGEPGLACGLLEALRRVYERDAVPGRGPTASCRVGKSRIVVSGRGERGGFPEGRFCFRLSDPRRKEARSHEEVRGGGLARLRLRCRVSIG